MLLLPVRATTTAMGRSWSRRATRRRSSSFAIVAVSCCGTGGPLFGRTISLVESFHPTTIFTTTSTTTSSSSNTDLGLNSHFLLSFRCGIRCYSSNDSSSDDEEDRHFVNNLPRIYVDSSSNPSPVWTKNVIVPLNSNQANYLNVMRITNQKRWGAWAGHLRIFNGSDGEWLAKIVLGGPADDSGRGGGKKKNKRRDNDAIVVECLEQLRVQEAESSRIHLHIGRLKKQRLKWILEKATELGVSSIDVVDTEFSSTVDAWEHDKHCLQVIEAAEQCERMTLPLLVENPGTWDSLVNRMMDEETNHPDEQWLICRERSPESLPLWQALASQDPSISSTTKKAYHVLVGPEGGWSDKELENLQDVQQRHPHRVQFTSMGSFILRAETAAIVALSAVALAQDSGSRKGPC